MRDDDSFNRLHLGSHLRLDSVVNVKRDSTYRLIDDVLTGFADGEARGLSPDGRRDEKTVERTDGGIDGGTNAGWMMGWADGRNDRPYHVAV